MRVTIQEQIKHAKKTLSESPTLEQLFDIIPDSVTTNGKMYFLRIEPNKGGITFIDLVEVNNPQKETLIHVECVTGIYDAMAKAIESLAENVTDEWEF